MKTAIIHDWLNGMRGGEKVLESLCDLYPDAP
ncbi:MAG TPA: glycosyl transferase, group 1 family protein, partial [Candidatus Sumerlaeota bacterium]|nr:glycosyl transferase, group 1 family protein [Candidatus Sumerlaeota bacterium]